LRGLWQPGKILSTMLSRAAIFLFFLPGCHLVFPHASTDSVDGSRPADRAAELPRDHGSAGVDLARVDLARDLPRADQGCPVQVVQLTAEADACLSGADGTGKYGTSTICNIGTGIDSVGVFRFDLGSIATSKIQSIKPTLAYAAADPACGGTCASCDGIEHAGTRVRWS
jgi:hypothetical protein